SGDHSAVAASAGSFIELGEIAGIRAAGKCRPSFLCDHSVEHIHHDARRHDMNPVRIDAHPDLSARLSTSRALDHNLILPAHRSDLIVHTLEYNRIHDSFQLTVLRSGDQHILRPYHHIHPGILRDIVYTGELGLTELHCHGSCHFPLEDIALADKVGDK